MIVVWLFLTITRVCLQFAVVVCPDYTHLIFLYIKESGAVGVTDYTKHPIIVADVKKHV